MSDSVTFHSAAIISDLNEGFLTIMFASWTSLERSVFLTLLLFLKVTSSTHGRTEILIGTYIYDKAACNNNRIALSLDIVGKNNEFLAQMRRREVNVDDIFWNMKEITFFSSIKTDHDVD